MAALVSATTKLYIACGADDRYCMPLVVMLSSLSRTVSPNADIHVYILSLGISSANRQRIYRSISTNRSSATLEFIDANSEWFHSLPARNHISLAAYLRLYLPVLLHDDCDKVIYLDCDIMVRKDVIALWQLDPGDYYVLAARDAAVQIVSSPLGLYNWQELGLPHDIPYFNSGVMVINLKKWRELNLSSVLVHYARDHNCKMRTHDQEALNAICVGHWGEIDATWNAMPLAMAHYSDWKPSEFGNYVEENYAELSRNPSIVHWSSHRKPWLPGFSVPFQRDWFAALASSGWFTSLDYRLWFCVWLLRHYCCWVSGFSFTKLISAIRKTNSQYPV